MPAFSLKGLRPEFGYDIVLTAKNAKGKSTETIHHMNTLNGAEKHTGKGNVYFFFLCLFFCVLFTVICKARTKILMEKE